MLMLSTYFEKNERMHYPHLSGASEEPTWSRQEMFAGQAAYRSS